MSVPPTQASPAASGRAPAGRAVVEQALRFAERAQPQRRRRRDVFDPALLAPFAVGAELAEQAEAGRAVLVAAPCGGSGRPASTKRRIAGQSFQRRAFLRRLGRGGDEPRERLRLRRLRPRAAAPGRRPRPSAAAMPPDPVTGSPDCAPGGGAAHCTSKNERATSAGPGASISAVRRRNHVTGWAGAGGACIFFGACTSA